MMVSEALAEARTRLIEQGWWTQFHDPWDNRLCAVQAVTVASVGSQTYTDSLRTLADVIRPGTLESTVVRRIASWNDAYGRTFNEVLDAFDQAILVAKERERDAE